MEKRLYLQKIKIIVDILVNPCYNMYTFPPIFRDGVRGGFAASAV
jgi:hypothetical protein